MTDTLNSWKQLFSVRENLDVQNRVDVFPQGGTVLSLNEAIIVSGCNVEIKDSDQVVINESVCCPPIEFVNIMGEQDINRPNIVRATHGRIVWTTLSPTAPRITWGIKSAPTANLVNGTGVEALHHEFFISSLVPGTLYEFIVGATRNFCSDAASSGVHSFVLGVLSEIAINALFNVTKSIGTLSIGVSTTLTLVRPTNWLNSFSSGGEAGTDRPIGLASSTPSILNIGAETVVSLSDLGAMRGIAAITSVP